MQIFFQGPNYATLIANVSGAELEVFARILAKARAVKNEYKTEEPIYIDNNASRSNFNIQVTVREVGDEPIALEPPKED